MGKHSGDGTATKILMSGSAVMATMLIGIITYVYTTDQGEIKDAVVGMASNVGKIHDEQIIQSAYMKNVDARIEVNKDAIRELHAEASAYWRK